jgi:hypothetical protein
MLIAVSLPSIVCAEDLTPQVKIVTKLYRDFAFEAVIEEPLNAGDGLMSQPRNVLRQYFTPKLIELILGEQRCAENNGICQIDFLPLWDGQDVVGTTVQIRQGHTADTVTAKLQWVTKETSELTYHLERTKQGWKIDDINYGKGTPTLAQLLEQGLPYRDMVTDSIFNFQYDPQKVHFEPIETKALLPACKRLLSDIKPLPEHLSVISTYSANSTRIYIVGIGGNIKLLLMTDNGCNGDMPYGSIRQKRRGVTLPNDLRALSDDEVDLLFKDALVRYSSAFGGKALFLKWLDDKTNEAIEACKGQSEAICPTTSHALQPRLQKILANYRRQNY